MAEPEYIDIQNPFESTFSLLQSMQQEIAELREDLAHEKEARIQDVSELKAAMSALTHEKMNARFEALERNVDEVTTWSEGHFNTLDLVIQGMRDEENGRFDALEKGMWKEEEERRNSCMAINKKLGQESCQWRTRCDRIDSAVIENKKMSDIFVRKMKEKHDDIVHELERHASAWRDNSLAVEPFKHFAVNRTGLNSARAAIASRESGIRESGGYCNDNSDRLNLSNAGIGSIVVRSA